MLKIFLLSANPREHSKLNTAGEFNLIQEEYQKSDYKNEFDLKIKPAANYDNLLEILMKNENSLIHFSGHGAEETGLILTDKNHSQKILKTDILKNLIEILQGKNKHIQCVFFNGCYTEIQAEAISPYVKYVIGMKEAVLDTDAVKLSKYFYKCLFGKRTIEDAFRIACHSMEHSIRISIVDFDENTKRAIYDPDPNDETASQPISKDKIPQLIVNKNFIVDDNLIPQSKENPIFRFQDLENLMNLMHKIDFMLLINACRHTLKEYTDDIEREISVVKTLVDLKKLLSKKFPNHKDNDTFAFLEFVQLLTQEEDIPQKQREQIKQWLEKIALEKNIKLPILPDQNSKPSSKKNPNSYLLISINQQTVLSDKFSLEAELVLDYQEGTQDYKSEAIESGNYMSLMSLDQIKTNLSELISIARSKIRYEFSCKPNLTIEFFVPFEYLGETFELWKVPIPGKRRNNLESVGFQYPLIIRCLDRYTEDDLCYQLKDKWEKIKTYKEIKNLEEIHQYLELLDHKHYCNKFYSEWVDKTLLSINIIDQLYLDVPLLEEQPEYDYLDEFQASGVPILLWSRNKDVLCKSNSKSKSKYCSVKEKLMDIFNIKNFKNIREIHKIVHELRKTALEDLEGLEKQKYLGYNLGFICDNPELIPRNCFKSYTLKGSN